MGLPAGEWFKLTYSFVRDTIINTILFIVLSGVTFAVYEVTDVLKEHHLPDFYIGALEVLHTGLFFVDIAGFLIVVVYLLATLVRSIWKLWKDGDKGDKNDGPSAPQK